MARRGVRYSSFIGRVIAYLLDYFIVFVPCAVIVWHIPTIMPSFFANNTYNFNALILLIISLILYVLLMMKFVTSNWQASPGKRLIGMYIIDVNGGKINLKQACMRTVLPLILFVSFLMTPVFGSEIKSFDRRLQNELLILLPEYNNAFEESGKNFTEFYQSKEAKRLLNDEMLTLPEKDYATVLDLIYRMYTTAEIALPLHYNILSTILMFVIMVWHFLAIFSDEKTTIHDLLTKTRVVNGRKNIPTKN